MHEELHGRSIEVISASIYIHPHPSSRHPIILESFPQPSKIYPKSIENISKSSFSYPPVILTPFPKLFFVPFYPLFQAAGGTMPLKAGKELGVTPATEFEHGGWSGQGGVAEH